MQPHKRHFRPAFCNLRHLALAPCCLAAGLAWLGGQARAQDTGETNGWMQHLRFGVPFTMNVKASFSENGTFNLPAGQTGGTASGVDHIYNDGYVRVDQTGDAGGFTSDWGYQNASQYNAGANTLTMHSASSYTTTGTAEKDAQPFAGVELAYGTDLFHLGPAHVGWEVGAALSPIRITDSSSLSALVNQSAFTFSTAGIVPPTAPYNGGPSGIGPTIHDTPTAVGSSTVPGTVTGSRELDVILYTFRLGPTVTWDIGDQFGVMAGAGPALGVVSGNYKFDETIVTAGGNSHNTGRIGMTDTVYGGYVNATLLYHAVAHGDVYVGAQFMPLTSASVSGMGRNARLDLSGALQLSLGVNWPF